MAPERTPTDNAELRAARPRIAELEAELPAMERASEILAEVRIVVVDTASAVVGHGRLDRGLRQSAASTLLSREHLAGWVRASAPIPDSHKQSPRPGGHASWARQRGPLRNRETHLELPEGSSR